MNKLTFIQNKKGFKITKLLFLGVLLYCVDQGEPLPEEHRQFWADNSQSNDLCFDAQVRLEDITLLTSLNKVLE